MKIRKIHIDCFGKFENYDLELSEGMNVIFGQNEDGKSTIMAFILMMFYGYSGRSKDLSKNLRDKYRPWNGNEMKGHILFEHKGILYRLERTFGKSNSSDKVKILDEITGETIKWASTKDPGQEFFGLGEEAFSKSVFIGQGGILVDASGKKDEITEKLLNLVTTGSEDVSYKKALDTLTSSMEALVSKSGKQGTLVKAKEEMAKLKEERYEAEQDELDKKQAHLSIGQLKEMLMEEEAKERGLKEQLKVLEYASEMEKVEEALYREEKLLIAEKEADQVKEKLSTREGMLTKEHLEHLKKLLKDQEDLSKKLQAEEERLKRLKQDLTSLKENPIQEVRKEDLEALKEKEEHLLKCKELLTHLHLEKEKLDELEEIKKKRAALKEKHTQLKLTYHRERKDLQEKEITCREGTAEKERLEEEKQQMELELKNLQVEAAILKEKVRGTEEREKEESIKRERSIKEAMERLQEAEKPRKVTEETAGGKVVHKGMLGLALLTAAASVVLAMVLEPIFYSGLLLAGILILLSIRKKSSVMRVVEIVDESLVARYRDELKTVQKESEEKKREIREALQEQKTKLEKTEEGVLKTESLLRELVEKLKEKAFVVTGLKKDLEEKTILSAQLEERLAGAEEDLKEQELLLKKEENEKGFMDRQELSSKITDTETERHRLKKETDDFLDSFQVDTYDGLLQLHHLYRGHQEKLKEKEENLQGESEGVLKLKRAGEENLKILLEKIADIKEVEDLSAAEQVLLKMEDALEEYDRLYRHVSYLKSERKPLELSMTREELASNKEELRNTIGKLLGKENYTEEDLQKVRQGKEEKEALETRVQSLREEITKKQTELKEKYRHRKNLSQIDDELDFYKEKVEKRQRIYDALKIAREQMEGAFSELQRSFGPKVNEKTEEIFRRLTDGKYQKVRVTKDFSISVEDPERKSSYEWGFLSGGTIDQAYLSLRLAISDLVMSGEENLPIFLDDVFTQYDDERAYEGLRFLYEYAVKKEESLQAVLFTCHRRLFEWARELGNIDVMEIGRTRK
ncbi:AAA family ATPase [Proteiniclasticum ruminis]|uniref:Uncharacterized protein YhaN n=1 Tax=Proteiniclasticum ruminis TaxID=398199 RepID=A0A1I5B995_9CLOT|nr:AAA family ATPase [Proteiniclasticum ruminis]SFN71079.1 Uncharacterized protein YhaN [Proteiniclasticum ruminis]